MAATQGGARAAPPYLCSHAGTAIVCGAAWTLPDDYERARRLFPDAAVIAVNGASAHVAAFALFTQHPRKFQRWISARQRLGGEFETHAAGKAHVLTRLGRRPEMPWVDYWWDGVASGGTSGWGARRLAAAMGFSRVVLCGIPLETGGYYDGAFPSKQNQRADTMQHYREQIEADRDMHSGCYSMSGWTRDLLGAPAGI